MEDMSHQSNDEDFEYYSNPLKYIDLTIQSTSKSHRRHKRRRTLPANHRPHIEAKKNKSEKKESNLDDLLNISSDEEGSDVVDRLIKRCKEDADKSEEEKAELVLEEVLPAFPEIVTKTRPSSDDCPRRRRFHRRIRRDENLEDGSSSIAVEDITISSEDVEEVDEVLEQQCTIEISDIEQMSTRIVRWKMNNSLRELVSKCAAKWGCEEALVHLSKEDGTILDVNKSPIELGFSVEDFIAIMAYKLKPVIADSINIVFQFEKRRITKTISKKEPLMKVKSELASEFQINGSHLKLHFEFCSIKENDTAECLELADGDIIDVRFGMLSARWSQCGGRCVRSISVSAPLSNHYETLGIDRSADAKEIKAAYYELSKKYHPDRHTDASDKQHAAIKFQEVASAYEVLGSDDKRRAYDATLARDRANTADRVGPQSRTGVDTQNGKRKMYTDLDIDYRNFEQFQRSTRRRRPRHHHWEMPDEFFAEFGGREFKSEYRTRAEHESANYKDSRAAEREKEERLRMQELEEQRKKSAHPIPTFEQLYRQQQARKAEEERKAGAAAALIAAAAAILVYILRRM
uniref:J domain-containing protein n=1 Tax=Ascaris lumbricoides TaxID=6252 RepID=A0A9J2PAR5_ASCLU